MIGSPLEAALRPIVLALKAIQRRLADLETRTRLLYAKGAYTPTYLGATTAGTTTYTTQIGAYVRIGVLVIVTGRITWTNATGTGVAVIGALPYTSRTTTNLRFPAALWVSAVTFAGSFVEMLLAENASAFTMYTTTTNAAATQLNIETAGDMAFTLIYLV